MKLFKRYLLLMILALTMNLGAQFTIGGDPRVDPDDFIVTTFAENLNFPLGMALLPDSSLAVVVCNGNSYFGSTSGSLLQLIDADNDGVAETQNVISDAIPFGALTALKIVDNWVFITGQGRPILIYRLEEDSNGYYIAETGRLTINYAGNWLHPNSAIEVRRTPNVAENYDLLIHLGSEVNFAKTMRKLELTSSIGLQDSLAGDALHLLQLQKQANILVPVSLQQVATGLRSAAGAAFSNNGDLYLQDNGIDGLTDPNEPHSADELNRIPASEIGGTIDDFGFPDNFTAYRTGDIVGGAGIQPIAAFQPIPDPFTGDESEGPNDIAFAPSAFPAGLNNGMFIGFHGKFFLGGLDNEENPLVYVDFTDSSYFHFIGVGEPDVGHLDGLLSTDSSLFVSDLSPNGGFGNGDANKGKIYRIHRKSGPVTGIETDDVMIQQIHLAPAYPNPFNPETTIRFTLSSPSTIELNVFNSLGQQVKNFTEVSGKTLNAGEHKLRWNGADDFGTVVESGVYFLNLRSSNISLTKKLVLLK